MKILPLMIFGVLIIAMIIGSCNSAMRRARHDGYETGYIAGYNYAVKEDTSTVLVKSITQRIRDTVFLYKWPDGVTTPVPAGILIQIDSGFRRIPRRKGANVLIIGKDTVYNFSGDTTIYGY